jgi:hypothetical protein
MVGWTDLHMQLRRLNENLKVTVRMWQISMSFSQKTDMKMRVRDSRYMNFIDILSTPPVP